MTSSKEKYENVKPIKVNMDSAPETRTSAKSKVNVVTVGDATVGRMTLEPGWRWSQHMKPIVKTDSCPLHHVGYVVSGQIKIVMDDGEELELGPGDVYDVRPGHDAWVLGNRPYVALELRSASQLAKLGK